MCVRDCLRVCVCVEARVRERVSVGGQTGESTRDDGQGKRRRGAQEDGDEATQGTTRGATELRDAREDEKL